MSTIPINSLSPTEPPPSNRSIRGIVTLFWPYSSSTRQCAFLLADPDFRLRNRQGQVRVRFTGASAEAVAKSHVGIGDEVLLALNGANWEEDPEATRTPGKSVGGELFFRRRLQLTVAKSEGDVQVNVDATSSPPRSMEEDMAEIATPQPRVGQLRSSLGKAVESLPGYAYTSPAFVKRLRLSGESFLDSAFDPFAEDDGQRTTFARGTNWRYAAGTPSPTKDTSVVFDNTEQESPVQAQPRTGPATNEVEEVSMKMPPPPQPKLQLPSASPPPAEQITDEQDGPSTPKLHPVRSPTLPLPSPFPVEGFMQSPFSQPPATTYAEDQTKRLSGSSNDITQHPDDETMTDIVEDTAPLQTGHTDQTASPTETQAHVISHPQTPTNTSLTTGFGVGFDGATASPVSQQKVSPQEVEKKRVMAQTYRSLFGFAGPPAAAQDQALQSPIDATQMPSELEKRRLDASSVSAEEEVLTEATVEQDTMSETHEVSAIKTAAISSEPLEGHKLPAQADEVEVIEIESSSEEDSQAEDETLGEQSPTNFQAIEARSRFKSPEISDTYQDSQAQDLMASQQLGDQLVSQDTVTSLGRQYTDDTMLETFIEEDKLYPELPPAEPQPQPESSEPEVNVTSSQADMSQPVDPQSDQPHTLQQPSYPSLPLSPSNSQSIQGMVSQNALDFSAAMGNMLPPTPQLTQAESSTAHYEELLPSEQPISQEILSDAIVESQDPATDDPMAAQKNQAEISEIAPEDVVQEPQPLEQPQIETPAPSKDQAEPGRMTRARARKANRVSIIPDAISSYFSPKRVGGVVTGDKETYEPSGTADETTNGHVSAPTEQVQLTNGFSTPLSYFTPLARLDSLLNPSSQGAYGSVNTVDVFAVVTESTTEPARAKAGPKDFYTIFRVTDSSLSHQTTLRVEVFRPYKNTLPAAKEGDVVLLRAFAVKSRKRQPYLLSSDASAWCVFRYPKVSDTAAGNGGKRKPKWALKAGEGVGDGPVSEEMKGPPVEFGIEERGHARDLRLWWELTHDGKDDVNDTRDIDGMAEANGHVAVSVGAKL